MEDDAFRRLAFPGKEPLLDYTGAAFEAASLAVESADAEALHKASGTMAAEERTDGTLGFVITHALTHNNRHLGMIEGLIGVRGLRGTATS